MTPSTFALVMFALGGGPLGVFRYWFEHKYTEMDDYYKSAIVLFVSTLLAIAGWQLLASHLAWEDVIAAATSIVGGGSITKKATAHSSTQKAMNAVGIPTRAQQDVDASEKG